MNGFSTAVTRGDRVSADSYLAAPLQAQAASQGLQRLLGLSRAPTSYQYTITSTRASHATVSLIYTSAGGSAGDTATLSHTPSGWRIDAIHPG